MADKNHNSSCRFAETLISYLYGEEIGARERSQFESHVLGCAKCADELSAFGGVRSSVHKWRDLEFAPLATPSIELPFETAKANKPRTLRSGETTSDSNSWLTNLREIFSFSKGWLAAATSLAALLVCAGLFYFAFSSFSNNSNAVAVEGNKNSIVSPAEAQPTQSQMRAANDSSQSGSSTVATGEKIVKPSSDRRLPEKVKNEAPAKNSSAVSERRSATNNSGVKLPKTSVADNGSKKVKPAIPVQSRKPARETVIDFSNRAEEDKSLRLSDLFDEVSMR
jgi:hypothetical protein